VNLVRYAGFDPHEDDFGEVELAPLHPQDLVKPGRPLRTNIDIDRAWHLKRLGRSWNEVGKILAREEGRKIAYRGNSVYFAANYAKPKEATT
jgi:hypothetical protein